ADIHALADSLIEELRAAVGEACTVSVEDCEGQIGSGALPVESLDSTALVIRPVASRGQGAKLKQLATSLRALPVPVIGRVHDDALWLDLRCLDDVDGFRSQLEKLQMT
ncbi:MAG: L-seryl-tRNA(Sec) selenium transferase, partial [Rhodospirillaceae bacterium]|nr:L-seryl-tRNA(Sec) selenium transferase [Rhodospirillaceae bacterium]